MKLQTVWKLSPIVTLALGTVLVTSCGKRQGGLPQSNEFPVMNIEATNTQLQYSYPAVIKGKQDIEIRPKISGFITRLCVDEGSVVHCGQVLFTIDDVQYREAVNQSIATYNTSKAGLATATLTYKNKKELYKQNIIGDYDLQTAQNSLAQAKAQLAQAKASVVAARQNLAFCSITSPSNGVVGSIPYRVGSLVSASSAQPLTTVSNIEQMYVYFSVTEKQLLELTREHTSKSIIGSFPSVRLQLADGSMYDEQGKVKTISGVIDQTTGSVSVRADFSNPHHLLKSGGTGSIVIPRQAQNCIIIPQSATVEVQDKIFVYVLGKDSKVKYTEIHVDAQNDGQNYIVTSGLNVGDRIVSNGITKLSDGMEIKPITEAQYDKNIQEAEKLGSIQGNYKEMKKAFSK